MIEQLTNRGLNGCFRFQGVGNFPAKEEPRRSLQFIRSDLRGLIFIRSDLRGLKICMLDLRGIKLSLRGAKYNLKKLRGTKIFINPVRSTKKSGRNPKLTPTGYPVLKMTNL